MDDNMQNLPCSVRSILGRSISTLLLTAIVRSAPSSSADSSRWSMIQKAVFTFFSTSLKKISMASVWWKILHLFYLTIYFYVKLIWYDSFDFADIEGFCASYFDIIPEGIVTDSPSPLLPEIEKKVRF